MTRQEFSDQFDLLYNNITSNQAAGLSEFEKSVFLTKGEKEVVKNYFSANSTGNTLKQGFDDSAKRQADFSVLMKTSQCDHVDELNGGTGVIKKYICVLGTATEICRDSQIKFTKEGEPYDVPEGTYSLTVNGTLITITVGTDVVTVTGYPFANPNGGTIQVAFEKADFFGQIDDRSSVWSFPYDTFVVVNESIKTVGGKYLQVLPLRYDEYTRLMSKPYKRPLKNQAWRLMNSGEISGNDAIKYVEVITNSWDEIGTYNIRYIRTPSPIILADFTADGLTIDGISTPTECELDPILHEDVLQRAVELAKIAWTATGNDNAQAVLAAGQRSE